MLLFFFFSSRRRHTRFDCDWSSDVCSSDLVAEGDVHEIRDLIDEQPHRIFMETADARRLAETLVKWSDVQGVRVDEGGVLVETIRPDAFYSRIPALVLEQGLKVESMTSSDDNLQAVFDYLVR